MLLVSRSAIALSYDWTQMDRSQWFLLTGLSLWEVFKVNWILSLILLFMLYMEFLFIDRRLVILVSIVGNECFTECIFSSLIWTFIYCNIYAHHFFYNQLFSPLIYVSIFIPCMFICSCLLMLEIISWWSGFGEIGHTHRETCYGYVFLLDFLDFFKLWNYLIFMSSWIKPVFCIFMNFMIFNLSYTVYVFIDL